MVCETCTGTPQQLECLDAVFKFFVIWLHSDILPIMANYWHWYLVVSFGSIGHLYNQIQDRHTTCPILKMRVNRLSMIFVPAAWEINVAIGCRQYQMRVRPPLQTTVNATCISKKWNWLAKMDPTHGSLSTFSTINPRDLFAIFHWVS